MMPSSEHSASVAHGLPPGWLEVDLVAEGLEFCDQAAGFPAGVQAAGEEISAEFEGLCQAVLNVVGS
jgi:hypothetical protein